MRSRGVVLLAAAVLLVGIAQMLVLPPFEGFDETAHYSYIREIADTRAIPVFGRSTMATVVAGYRQGGPMPYTTVAPFNDNGGWTYETFFANPALHDAYRRRYRSREPAARPHEPTSELNWEAQHPPLYYALLAPLMRATDAWSFNAQFFVLRLASYLLAWLGLLVGLSGTIRYFPVDTVTRRALIAGALLYPFLVPMFLPEFGRLGNDSLCMFLVGIAWTALLQVIAEPRRMRAAIGLGIVLGMGLLTKAFFLAIGAGVGAYLLYRSVAARANRPLAKQLLRQALTVAAVALALGGWWYVYKFLAFDSVTGGEVLINLDAQGGLLTNLRQKFAIRFLGRGLAALVASGYYTGTWSLTRLPEILYVPGLLLLAIIAGRAFGQLRRVRLSEPDWAPVWIAAPLVGGFLYFLFVRIALSGSGNNVGGWYFSVLAPVVAVLFGLGLKRPIVSGPARWIVGLLAAYALAFWVAGQWAETALYSGCAIKTANSKYFVFSDDQFCLTRLPGIVRNLTVIGWPILAAGCFVAGLFCLLLGVKALWPAGASSHSITALEPRVAAQAEAHRR
jgi:hypothetical protein